MYLYTSNNILFCTYYNVKNSIKNCSKWLKGVYIMYINLKK